MKKLDSELVIIKKLLDAYGVKSDRYLFTIKRGWITLSIDNNPIIEFNVKNVTELNNDGKLVDQVEYKWKEGTMVKKSFSWDDLQKMVVQKL